MQTSFFELLEDFDAWPRNKEEDLLEKHGGYLLVVLHSFLNVSFFTVPVRLSGVNGINYAGRV